MTAHVVETEPCRAVQPAIRASRGSPSILTLCLAGLLQQGCLINNSRPVETQFHRDIELAVEPQQDPPQPPRLAIGVTQTDPVVVEVAKVQQCLAWDDVRVDRTIVTERKYEGPALDRMRSLRSWGLAGVLLGGAGFAGLSLQESPAVEGYVAAGAVSVVGAVFLGNYLVMTTRDETTEEHVGAVMVRRNERTLECAREPVSGQALVVGTVRAGQLDDAGQWTLDVRAARSPVLRALMEGAEFTDLAGLGSVSYAGTPLAQLARDECESRAAPAREAAAKRYDALYDRYLGSALVCGDGRLSPSCVCGGNWLGCCSHHGGVAGCSRERPMPEVIELCPGK